MDESEFSGKRCSSDIHGGDKRTVARSVKGQRLMSARRQGNGKMQSKVRMKVSRYALHSMR